MAHQKSVILVENNIISLRTAFITDLGSLVAFRLQPTDLASKVPQGRTRWAPKDFDWVKQDSVWLYRHMRSADDELKLKTSTPTVDLGVKPLSFEATPRFKLIWADSGHSVAVCLNAEPWAFIDETSHQGYSKGILNADYAGDNPWNQSLFERIFGSEA
jgi:hypothetical protein